MTRKERPWLKLVLMTSKAVHGRAPRNGVHVIRREPDLQSESTVHSPPVLVDEKPVEIDEPSVEEVGLISTGEEARVDSCENAVKDWGRLKLIGVRQDREGGVEGSGLLMSMLPPVSRVLVVGALRGLWFLCF